MDRYRIVDRLGIGGMGVVYRAEDLSLRRLVALKFLGSHMAADEEYRARFLREARVAASLNHPNTCVVYEVGQVDREVIADEGLVIAAPGTPFIAMELVEGETLAAWLARAGPLPPAAALDIALQVAAGLAEAHARQIVHRDLKPHNVMITPAGRVKIVDFGLAKPIGSAAGAKAQLGTSEMISADIGERTVVGTCAYMSPEQAAGRPLDARSDVFAFGILLYEVIAGRLPFQGATPTETIAKILEAEPAVLPRTAAGEPTVFEPVVRRCLRKKPDDRYADAQELLAALQEVKLRLPDENRARPLLRRAADLLRGATNGWRRRVLVPAAAVLAALAAYLLAPAPSVVERSNGGGDPAAIERAEVQPEPVGAAAPEGNVDPAMDPVAAVQASQLGDNSPPTASTAAAAPRQPAGPQSSPQDQPGAETPPGLPSATVAILRVTSLPRASVTLDGALLGVTPLTLEADPGPHEVLLTGPDGRRWRGRLDLIAGQVTALDRNLDAAGSLTVVSDVWVHVSLDEGPPEQTPIHFARLATGLHTLRAFRSGYVTKTLEIFIEEGKTASVRLALEKEP